MLIALAVMVVSTERITPLGLYPPSEITVEQMACIEELLAATPVFRISYLIGKVGVVI